MDHEQAQVVVNVVGKAAYAQALRDMRAELNNALENGHRTHEYEELCDRLEYLAAREGVEL